MRWLLVTGLALALAGCGAGGDATNNSVAPTPSPTPGPILGGVALEKPIRASGTGPFWSIYLAPGKITYADAPKAAPVDFYPATPKFEDGVARFETHTADADPVTITLTAKACTAGEAALPLTAEARIGSQVLKGCAGPDAYEWAERKKAQMKAAETR